MAEGRGCSCTTPTKLLGEEVLHFPQGLLDETSEPAGVGLIGTVEGGHMEEHDKVSLDDIGDAITILGHLYTDHEKTKLTT